MTGSRLQVAIAAVIFLAAAILPSFLPRDHADYVLQVAFRVFLFAALGLAWNLVGGYAGQLSLGHAAYFGVGAYGLALFTRAGVNPWLALAGGVVAAMISAVVIGSVSFRLRGPYFCLATIAFTEVLHLIAKNTEFTGGDVGVTVPSLFTGHSTRSFYFAALALTVICFAITYWVERSRFGYYLMAIREDEDTALSVGVNTSVTKLWALLISAALTAIAGALSASLVLYIVPDDMFGVELSVQIAILPMLGGAGTLLGPVLGSVMLESASEYFKNTFKEAHLLIYGVLIVLVVIFLPDGVVGFLRNLLSRKPKPPTPFEAVPPPSPAEESARVGLSE